MSALHRHTPTLNVVDSRGVQIRQVRYLCNDPFSRPQARISRSLHDIYRQSVEHHSPTVDASPPTTDFSEITSLSGAILLTRSADAGWCVSLFGEAGQLEEKWDARGSHWQFEHDSLMRPIVILEQHNAGPQQAMERLAYADGSTDNARYNLCGRLVRHDDSAGSRALAEYDLDGNLIGETRRLLKKPLTGGWPKIPEERETLLEDAPGFSTAWDYAVTGELRMQKDASGHIQRREFDVAGQLKKITLQKHDDTGQTLILDQVTYNEQGQITSQNVGGKINQQTSYQPANGWVKERKVATADGRILQSMHVDYDRVGNIVSVTDSSKAEQHHTNQRILPVSTYEYDSLYQLIQATGREIKGARVQASLPAWLPASGDLSRLVNFTQRYSYDARGNLITLRHQSEGNNYTRALQVAVGSNRALRRKKGDVPPDLDNGFDANGNQLALQPGQPLEWNNRNQLQRVAVIERADGDADQETYLYDATGQRVRKRQIRKAHATTHLRQTLYLPGLEVRTDSRSTLDVITVDAGACQVTCLYWKKGRPDAINNGALRYTFNDHPACTTLELDGDGQRISEEGYYPFGSTAWRAARSEIVANYRAVRYSGKERDASGLYYYGSRYYAPWLQRWISADPAGRVDGLNLYAFVANNPLRYKDHAGLFKYEIGTFSTQPTTPAPAATRASVAHSASSAYLDPGDLERYRLAYDTIWTTRSLLSNGPGNQIGAISNSLELSSTMTNALRANVGQPSAVQPWAQHAVAAATGNCDEYAVVSSSLLSSSARNSQLLPVHLSEIPGHRFTLLGDPGLDPLVIDPWVIYPMPHLLSESRYPQVASSLNVTPRMPQDPAYEIAMADVAALAPLYAQQPQQNPTLVNDQLVQAYSTGASSTWIWHQLTSQQQSTDINISDGFNFFNFAEVPVGHLNQIEIETRLADDIGNMFPANYFKRF